MRSWQNRIAAEIQSLVCQRPQAFVRQPSRAVSKLIVQSKKHPVFKLPADFIKLRVRLAKVAVGMHVDRHGKLR
jgi:hypothetical protein